MRCIILNTIDYILPQTEWIMTPYVVTLVKRASKWNGFCSDSDSLGNCINPAIVKTIARLKIVSCVPLHNQKSSE